MLSINSNLSSLIAQNNVRQSTGNLQTSYERLSSGKRINSAKDDAAGLAISDRLTAQIRGLNQAARNANDGISLGQTGEGAMQETSNMLQRMRELAVQSANDTNSVSDRESLNQEFQDLSDEMDRIAKTTSFNGKKILDGSAGEMTFQVGANVGETINVNLDESVETSEVGELFTTDLNIKDTSTVTGVSSATSLASAVWGLQSGDLVINDVTIGAAPDNGPGENPMSAVSIAEAINAKSGQSGVSAEVETQAAATITGVGSANTQVAKATTSATLMINGETIVADTTTATYTAQSIVDAINNVSGEIGVTATYDSGSMEIVLNASDGKNISVLNKGNWSSTLINGAGPTDQGAIYTGNIKLRGAEDIKITSNNTGGGGSPTASSDAAIFTTNSWSPTSIGALDAAKITDKSEAEDAIRRIDQAIDEIDSLRATFGAVQNRFESVVANNHNARQNLSAARSRILDADIAKETARLTQNSITQQAGVSILSQANNQPQIALQLLGG